MTHFDGHDRVVAANAVVQESVRAHRAERAQPRVTPGGRLGERLASVDWQPDDAPLNLDPLTWWERLWFAVTGRPWRRRVSWDAAPLDVCGCPGAPYGAGGVCPNCGHERLTF